MLQGTERVIARLPDFCPGTPGLESDIVAGWRFRHCGGVFSSEERCEIHANARSSETAAFPRSREETKSSPGLAPWTASIARSYRPHFMVNGQEKSRGAVINAASIPHQIIQLTELPNELRNSTAPAIELSRNLKAHRSRFWWSRLHNPPGFSIDLRELEWGWWGDKPAIIGTSGIQSRSMPKTEARATQACMKDALRQILLGMMLWRVRLGFPVRSRVASLSSETR
ncbi:uncharacterized protein BJX67DRAFT_183687 [Aspergillus lucknowensis]|uniref:Uncharacterized protein n=1 Tax=Aspergillus lucknowensis TaxID=176173 RepID=A0ABR4LLG4_9EURO